jgi:hypothetical protein
MGYSFEPKGLSIVPKTLANFLERKTQLYEQGDMMLEGTDYTSGIDGDG